MRAAAAGARDLLVPGDRVGKRKLYHPLRQAPPAGRDDARAAAPPAPPESVPQGSLQNAEFPLPPTMHPGHLAEFWHALGGRARATLNYTVTLAAGPAGRSRVASAGRAARSAPHRFRIQHRPAAA